MISEHKCSSSYGYCSRLDISSFIHTGKLVD